jgi:hypothetical protein
VDVGVPVDFFSDCLFELKKKIKNTTFLSAEAPECQMASGKCLRDLAHDAIQTSRIV